LIAAQGLPQGARYGFAVADEHVFTVVGASATPLVPVSLSDAGFLERSHLQEWVVAHPEILGNGVKIVTLEFAQWRAASGTPERDRLDVLGLDRSGRLVVAELKRDVAPDTVEMQALKYAAMASRFSREELAAEHARFHSQRGDAMTADQALEALDAHCGGVIPENLAKPRIVLLASSFPAVVTATTVWLTEMSLDITLMTFQAYRDDDRVIVTVSQLYPVADVAEFTVAPARSAKTASEKTEQLPMIPWTEAELARLRGVTSATVIAALDLGSASPDQWVGLRVIEERAARSVNQAKGELAGLTMMVKHRFQRSNWPFEAEWGAGGEKQSYYRVSPGIAEMWNRVNERDEILGASLADDESVDTEAVQ
jgi:hypothetical protein